jgi:DNA-binding NarL/FixJ family response regulator
MSKTRILIADDHQMFRAGIVNLLIKEADFEIAGEAAEGMDAVRLASELNPDVVLMDIDLPVLDGINATGRIVEKNPEAKILVLTSFENEDYILQMLKAGAKGYILKDSPFEDLVLAIKTISKGSSYFAKEISAKLLARLHQTEPDYALKEPPKKNYVTTREREVLKYVASELTNKEIAAKLFISPRTVETHRRNLIQKLKVKNTAGLVKYYIEHFPQNETLPDDEQECAGG